MRTAMDIGFALRFFTMFRMGIIKKRELFLYFGKGRPRLICYKIIIKTKPAE